MTFLIETTGIETIQTTDRFDAWAVSPSHAMRLSFDEALVGHKEPPLKDGFRLHVILNADGFVVTCLELLRPVQLLNFWMALDGPHALATTDSA